MNYYKQINRETGEVISYLTCSATLLDNDEHIQLVQLTQDEYIAEIAIMQKLQENETDEEVTEE